MEPRDVRAAGAVVTRPGGEVLVIHRPKYDDWSFPKGKLDRGEHTVAAAVREVAEETGLHIRLGPALPSQRYRLVGGRVKRVDYWVSRVIGSDDVTSYEANAEIDQVEWLTWVDADRRLSHDHDRDTLAQAYRLRHKTRPVVVLRHAMARSRRSWSPDDRDRPLLQVGGRQAQKLVLLLAAFDATAIHTSTSKRCVDTVLPYADATGWPVTLHEELSEEAATVDGILDLVEAIIDAGQGAVVCTHRPVLPTVMDALGVEEAALEPAEMLVVHHRRGRIVSTERHQP